MNRIDIDSELYLDQVNEKDIHLLAEYLSDYELFQTVLNIPFPYQLSDGLDWVKQVERDKQKHGFLKNWAIRNADGALIGGIGQHLKYGLDSAEDEIGYWLAKPLWGKGIMTKIVAAYSNYLIEQRKYETIEAVIFEGNDASGRVLEKCGYQFMGVEHDAIEKEGRKINGLVYKKNKLGK